MVLKLGADPISNLIGNVLVVSERAGFWLSNVLWEQEEWGWPLRELNKLNTPAKEVSVQNC